MHRWDVPYAEARRIQEELARRVQLAPLPDGIRLVAGADMSLNKARGMLFAAVVVLSLPGLEVVEERTARARDRFPYIPGLLSFREGPVVLKALRRLRSRPDVVIFGWACRASAAPRAAWSANTRMCPRRRAPGPRSPTAASALEAC